MKIKTSEATLTQIDYLVAKCLAKVYATHILDTPSQVMVEPVQGEGWFWFNPSENWSQGGPIIERENICLVELNNTGIWRAFCGDKQVNGPTPLIAAMRCFVASKLGDEVDIPEELA